MGQSFSQQTLKLNVKMAVSRLSLMRSKKSNLLQTMKRDIATLLAQDKVLNAEIKSESLIHEENLIIATEILELHCEKIASRVTQIASQQKCPEDIFISIATIIYCSTRLPVPEFKGVATQMALKYTKAWVMPLNERKQYVDPKVLALIDVTPPSRSEITQRLTELGKEFNVAYNPPKDEISAKPSPKDITVKSTTPNEDQPASLQVYENETKKSVIAVSPKASHEQKAREELESLKAVAQTSLIVSSVDKLNVKLPESDDNKESDDGKDDGFGGYLLDEKKDGSDLVEPQNTREIDELMKRLDALKSP